MVPWPVKERHLQIINKQKLYFTDMNQTFDLNLCK